MVPVAFAAIPLILTLVRLRVSEIFAIAFQAFAVLPAPAWRIVLASIRFGFAHLAVVRILHDSPSAT